MARVKKLMLLLVGALICGCLGNIYTNNHTGFSVMADDGYTDVNDRDTLIAALAGTDNVRLTGDITSQEAINVERTVTIDLNGYAIRYNGTTTSSVIEVNGQGDLTIKDSNTTKHYYTQVGNIYNFGEGLTPSQANGYTTGGLITGGTNGGIAVAQGTSLTLNGGTIAGNSGEVGGLNAQGNVTIVGGKVIYNYSQSGTGGVYVGDGGQLKLSGETIIDDNKSGDKNSNVVLATDKKVEVAGMLTGDASIAITATEPAKSPITLADGIISADVIKYFKTDSIDKANMRAFRQVVAADGSIVWKEVTLVNKPSEERVVYNGQKQTPTQLTAINSNLMTASSDDATYKNAHTYQITLTLDTSDAMWSDGDMSSSCEFDYIIEKKLINAPAVGQTEFTYTGEEISLGIADSDDYTISGASQTEAGKYTATLTLTDPYNTAWANLDSDTLSINFEISISQETSLLWLVLLLAAILIEELVVSNIYWHKRDRRTQVAALSGNSQKADDNINEETDDNDNNDDTPHISNTFSVTPFGIALLAVNAPMWQIIAIVLLSAAIIIVAAYNIAHAYKVNKLEAEEHGFNEHGTNIFRRFFVSAEPSTDTTITFIPPAPQTAEQENSEEEKEPQLIVRKIQVNGCEDIPNPNPYVRANEETQKNDDEDNIVEATEYPAYNAEIYDDDDDADLETLSEELPSEVVPVENKIEIKDENGEVAEVLNAVDYNTDTAYVVRYKKSFTARLIQAWDESKEYYTELKNEALSYNNVKSNVSWDYDCISVNLRPAIKFDVRGKTLCMYLPLNPDDYSDGKNKLERTTIKKCEDMPGFYRIKNFTRLNYAKKLIAEVMAKYALKQGNIIHRNYAKPYEPIEQLVEMGLAKEYLVKEKYSDFLKKSQKDKQASAQITPDEIKESEETKPLINVDDEDIEEVRVVDKATGKEIIKKYNKSFTAKFIQATDETKSYYATLKNELLSYNKTKSTIWWNCDSIHTGNRTIARFGIQDGQLCLYLALKTSDYKKSYPVEEAEGKRYAHVPCMLRIKNSKRCKDATRLIYELAQKYELVRGATKDVDYYKPFETTEKLIDKELIKEVDSKENTEEKKRLSRKIVEKKRQIKVNAQDADKLLDDKSALSLVEDKRSGKSYSGKKMDVSIGKISSAYDSGEVVNIETLKHKGIIPHNVGYVKVTAGGELDKQLIVEAQDFSIGAVKMIILTGGTARKI